MVDYGKDYHYANTRLRDSVALVRGYPKMIAYVNSNGVVGYYDLDSGVDNTCTLKDVSTESIPLGFLNQGRGVKYLCRMPKKQYRQGLTSQTVYNQFTGRQFNPNTPLIINTVLGKYPHLSYIIDLIECGEKEIGAFSRTYALGKKVDKKESRYELHYKRHLVGDLHYSNYGAISVRLNDKFKFLQEDIMEKVYVQQ